MDRLTILVFCIVTLVCLITPSYTEGKLLSSVLAPESKVRQSRSFYDYRYSRPIYDREYDRPRCGRCDDRYDEDDDDDSRDRDDDRRSKPNHNSKKNYEDDKYDDRKNGQKNSTDDEDDKRHDKSSSRRDRNRHRDRNRYDDRDRYRPDYYDRFLRDPYRERDYDRPYRDDYYRRPYERYPDRYGGGGYGGGYEGYASRYDVYRRPYEDRFDDYGGYGPVDDRSQHGSFRPWDETYRGQSGWDAGGRGYYFASGRPEAAPAQPWGRPEYARPQSSGWSGGYSNTGYSGYSGQRDPLEYRVSVGYPQNTGYRQDLSSAYGQGYGQSGWQSVGERRPYRDSSGVTKLDNKDQVNKNYKQPTDQIYGADKTTYGQNYAQAYGQNSQSLLHSTTERNYLFARNDQIVNSELTVKDKSKTVVENTES